MLLAKDLGGVEAAREMKDVVAVLAMLMLLSAFAGLAVAMRYGVPMIREVRPYTVALWVLAVACIAGGLVQMAAFARLDPASVRNSALLSFGGDVMLALGLLLAAVGLTRAKESRLAGPLTIASAVALFPLVPFGSIAAVWWFVSVRPAESGATT